MILNSLRLSVTAALLAWAGVSPGRLEAQEQALRRIATVATIAIEEYGLGVVDGVVTSEDEYNEAVLFLEEAAASVAEIESAEARDFLRGALEGLSAGVSELRNVSALRRQVDELRASLVELTGVSLDVLPNSPPMLRAGELAYRESCASCHGSTGAADGPAAASLDPPPAALDDRAALSSTSPLDFYRIIEVGIAGTAMPGFEAQYSDEQRWALALYAAGLRYRDTDPSRGRLLLERNCAGCDLVLSGPETVAWSDDSLRAFIRGQSVGEIDSDQLTSMVAFARTAPAAERLGGNRELAVRRVAVDVQELLETAAAVAREGRREAASRTAMDAYLAFERIEAIIRAKNGSMAGQLESEFAEYRAALAGAPLENVEASLDRLSTSLRAGVSGALAPDRPSVLFGKSLLIMLREGLEAILIVGALIAFLVRSGHGDRKRDIGWGILAAVAASLVTAAVFGTVMQEAIASQELIEGITMLVAAFVLFWVSYWLVSKIEMRKWQEFVRVQMNRALASSSRLALIAVAFLAVYREGFETVLFYSALFASTGGSAQGAAGVTSGIVVGFAALVVVYLGIQRFGVKIPLKPFFGVTSALLYVMAFSFAGQGIAELQASGYVSSTPVLWAPTVPLLGIFPTAQTLTIQSLLGVAILGAIAWVFWIAPRTSSLAKS